MKIAYFINQYPTVSHSFIRREILALERQGIAIERFSLRRDPSRIVDAEDREEAGRTRYLLEESWTGIVTRSTRCLLSAPLSFAKTVALAVRIGLRSDRGLFRHLVYLMEACVLKEWLKARGVNHLHAHFGTNSTTVAMFCGMLGNVSYSFTVHGPEEFDKPEFIAMGEKIRRARFVVAITSFCRSQLYRQVESEHWGKIHQVHCGLDSSFLESELEPELELEGEGDTNQEPIVFTCIGRLCEQKGQLLLLDAFRELLNTGVKVKLILAGDGPMRGELEERIQRYRMGDSVEISGWIDGARVRRYLRSSRAMVLPSFAEGLPVVIMEAMALGKPVITTYIAGIPELVQDSVNGWLIPAGCRDSIVRAMREAAEAPPDRCRQMGGAGREVVRSRHNIDREVEKLAGLFGAAA